jgi:hypothetical protein
MAQQNIKTRLKIVDIAHKKIDELALIYLEEHGPIHKWSLITKSIFSLNCDVEILAYLKTKNFSVHENLLETGIAFGLLIIKSEIETYFKDLYKEKYFSYIEEISYNINLTSYNYIVTGFEETNGN